MDNAERVQNLLAGASELAPDQRPGYLDAACAGDDALRAEVESLLNSHEVAGRFLASPTADGGHAGGPSSGLVTMTAPIREGPGTRIGPYKILQLIGEGGFGSVFMAEQEKPVSRKVALKIIKLGMDTRSVVARFEAERQALAIMEHPNIARVLDAGATDTGRPFFVMELCKGEAIHDYCDKHNLSINERLELFSQVCTAVQHAHTKGIIHRDIKPSNVLVSTQDGRAHAKVIDFGIAKATASKLTEKTLFTEHRALIGTPEYMSPEQAEGSLDIDTRTDVYSLGVLLYELLTGTTPFSGKQLRSAAYAEVQRIIREVEPPKPSTCLSHNTDTIASVAAHRHTEPKRLGTIVRGDLDWIVMKALEKDRQRRYETASGLATDIQRYLVGEAVLAAPPSAAYRIRKFVKRHRAQVAAAALVTIALVLGLAGTAWQAKVASDQALAATKAQGEADAAREAESQRADELWQVSEFQKQMLKQVDAATAGVRLTQDVNRRFIAALEKARVPESERAIQTEAFRTEWARVNATDAAAALIDETILRPAVKAIDEQFKAQPVVDALLRQVIASRYDDLALYDAAYPLQRSALETRRRVLGPDHPNTLQSVCCMGLLLEHQGKLAEAEGYLRESLEKGRIVRGEEDRNTLTDLDNLGMLLSARGKLDEAELYCREALDRRRRVLGEQHPSTIVSTNNMGILLDTQGKFAQAEKYYREGLEKSRSTLGEQHAHTISLMANLGSVLLAQRKLDQAEPYLRESLELRRLVCGEEHPATISSINNLGELLHHQGKLAEAEPFVRETLEKRRRVLGEEHAATLVSINNLGTLLQSQGKLEQAELCIRDVLEKSRRVLGPDHPDTLRDINNMAALLKAQGKMALAEAYYRDALERHRRVLGEAHPYTLIIVNELSGVLQAQSKPADAEAVLAEGLGACERAFTSPHQETALLLHHHADALRASSRPDDALSEARRAVEMYREHLDWPANESAHAVLILGAIVKDQGRPDEELTVLREGLHDQRRRLASTSADLAEVIRNFAQHLLIRGTLEAVREAEPLLRESLNIRIKAMPDNWTVPRAKSVLGGSILTLVELDTGLTPEARAGRLREAERLLLDGYEELRVHPGVPKPAEYKGIDRRRDALEGVVHLYEVWDKAEPGKGFDARASEWKAKLDVAKSAAIVASDPEKKP